MFLSHRNENSNTISLGARLFSSGKIEIDQVAEDPWADLGYWLEATAFLASQAMQQKDMNQEEIAEYCKNYITKALVDYYKNS